MFTRRTTAKVLSSDDDVAGSYITCIDRLDFAKDILGEFKRVDRDVIPTGDDLVGVHVLSEGPGFAHVILLIYLTAKTAKDAKI